MDTMNNAQSSNELPTLAQWRAAKKLAPMFVDIAAQAKIELVMASRVDETALECENSEGGLLLNAHAASQIFMSSALNIAKA